MRIIFWINIFSVGGPAWCTLKKDSKETAIVRPRLPVTHGAAGLRINGGKGQSDRWTWTCTRFSPYRVAVTTTFCVSTGRDSRELGLSCGHKSPAEEELVAAAKKKKTQDCELRTATRQPLSNATRTEPCAVVLKGNTLLLQDVEVDGLETNRAKQRLPPKGHGTCHFHIWWTVPRSIEGGED